MKCAWCGGTLTALGCDCSEAIDAALPLHCACCGAQPAPRARFCSECGATFIRRGPAGQVSERRQISFLFCDLVGSTALSDGMDPEDYKDILVAYRDAVHATMRDFGGWVDRFRGDGTLVYFGYPEAHEDDTERALHAALESIHAVGGLRVLPQRRLQVRMGIATGMAVISDIEDPWERTAMGDTPNIAARLQNLAEPDTVVVDAASRRMVGDLFEFCDLGPRRLKGLVEPVHVWKVVGARPVASRFEARGGDHLVRFIGREEESRTLLRLWHAARDGRGRIALITGEAGIGKSRLAASLLEAVTAETAGICVFRYFCSPYRQGSALHPFIQQLELAAGFTASDTPSAKAGKLSAILDGTPAEDLALVAELLNVPVAHAPAIASLSPPARRRRTMQALLALLERTSRQQPALLVFEDAQWADASSRELLQLVAALVPRMAILLLVLARPDAFTALDGHPEATRIVLTPLSGPLSTRLALEVAGQARLAPAMLADIVARTDGIPLFIEELTRAMTEAPSSSEPAAGPPATSTLPMLLRASLLPRLNRLGRAREVLEVAATIGRDFPLQLVTLVLGPRDDLRAQLNRLVASGLVLPQGVADGMYTFKHALIRDAAYEILGRDVRRDLHRRVARAIEENFPDVPAHHPEILAWHFTGAGNVEKAVAHWLLAGRNALRRSAMGEALNHLQRGLGLAGTAEPSAWRLQNELALTICMGMALIATEGYAVPGTGETFARARALCEQLGDPPPLLAVLHGLWTHALLRADFASAQRSADQILARGEAKGDALWRLMGLRFTGVTCHPLGRFADAMHQLEGGLRLYDSTQRAVYATVTVDDPRVVMLTYLSWSQMCAGRLADALRNSGDAVAQAQEMEHVYTLAHALNGAAFVAMTIVSPQAGLARLDALRAAIADNGIAYYEAVETIFRGCCLAETGAFDEAMELLARGLPAYRATQSILYLSGFLRMSAQAHALAGRLGEAMDLIGESMAVMEASGQRWDEAEIHRVHGTLLRASGQRAAAEQAFRRAWAVADRQGAGLWELRACCELLEEPAGVHAREARSRVRSILGGFDDALDLPDVRRARSLLAARDAVCTGA